MCDLCRGGEDREKEEKRILDLASTLKDMARVYELLANGIIKPHTKGWSENVWRAKRILRALMEDWL